MGGTVTYGEGPLNYAINARSDQVRIRYPVGMSWLVAGNLRLSGNAQASTLSGRIVVDRLLMAEGFDLAGIHGFGQGTRQRSDRDFLIPSKFAIRHPGRIQS